MGDGGKTSRPEPISEAPRDAHARPDALPSTPRDRSEWTGPGRFNQIRRERAEAGVRIQRALSGEQQEKGRAKIPQSGGAPLDGGYRSKMERQLGARLDGARVNTSAESARAAEQLGARAFTVGDDVHFGAGQYAPGTKEGDRLLAHELTHVVQGQLSGVQRKSEGDGSVGEHHAADAEHGAIGEHEGAEHEVSQPGDPAEKEADAVADRVAENMHSQQKEAGDGNKKDGAEHAMAGAEHSSGAGKKAGQEKAPQIGAKLRDPQRILRTKGAGGPSDQKGTPPATSSKPGAQQHGPAQQKQPGAGQQQAPAQKTGQQQAQQQGGTKGARVEAPVPGLYGSIDPLSTPKGWQIKDEWPKDRKTPHLISVITTVVDPQGKQGMVERAYDTDKKQFVMLNAFLIKPGEDKSTGVQSFIEHAEPTMIKGRGTPTQTFLTLRQMKLLEQHTSMKTADLTKVKMSTIQNIEAICQLEKFKREGMKPDQAVMQTESKKYAETTLVQAGKRIKSGKLVGGTTTPLAVLLQHYEDGKANRHDNFEKLLARYGIKRTDPVLWNYDIEFEVEEFSKGDPAK
jgi:hypothetical protein